jgi:hypothetical protein
MLHPLRHIVEYPAISIFSIGGGGVLVERIGGPHHSSVLNQAREVFLAQKTEDAIDRASVSSTCTLHNPLGPAQMISHHF